MAPRKKPTSTAKPPDVAIKSITVFGLGLLVIMLCFMQGDSGWKFLSDTLFSVFGFSAYILGPILIYFAYLVASRQDSGSKLVGGLAVLLLVSAAALILSKADISKDISLLEKVKYLGEYAKEGHGGGYISAAIGLPLLLFFGKTPATVFVMLFIFLMLMVFTGITPYEIFSFFGAVAGNTKKRYDENKAERAEYLRQNPPPPPPERPVFDFNKHFSSKSAIDLPVNSAANDSTVKTTYVKQDGVVENGFERSTSIDEKIAISTLNALNAVVKNAASPIDIELESPKVILPIRADDELPEGAIAIEEANFLQPEAIIQEIAEPPIDSLIQRAMANKNKAPKPEEIVPLCELQTTFTQYNYPTVNFFEKQEVVSEENAEAEMKRTADLLVSTLESFGVQTKMMDICRGPSLTRYELQPLAGVKISKITALSDDLALNLASAGVRIEAPIPNKAAVGIEVPNKNSTAVGIRSIIESSQFRKSESPLTIALGMDIAGDIQVADLTRMPHLLIAGSTGSGKSVCINAIIISFLYKSSPDDVKLILIDPKIVELAEYNGIPHLLMPVVTEPRKAAGALGAAVVEMERRYREFADKNVRDIKSYNNLAKKDNELEKLPYIAIIIDELADLMMVSGKEVEDYICRIAQKARAAGMHLIVATQRPSVDVITGLIKANIPSRIAFAVSSQIDSRTILDGAGAEKLLGRGDMLFMPVGSPKPVRIQCNYVTDVEISRVLGFIKSQADSNYDMDMIESTEKIAAASVKSKDKGGSSSDNSDDDVDQMYWQAVEVIIDASMASTSLLQRRLKLGYARAARIMDEMERNGVIGPFEGSKPRAVLMSRQEFLEKTVGGET